MWWNYDPSYTRFFKECIDQGKNAFFCSDQLVVDGVKYIYDDTTKQPYCENFEIVCFCETWQIKDDDYSSLLPGYTNFDSPRKTTKGKRGAGGVTVFIKSWLIENGIVRRIYTQIEEAIVLHIDKTYVGLNRDLVIY